jgi:hypothetical protein
MWDSPRFRILDQIDLGKPLSGWKFVARKACPVKYFSVLPNANALQRIGGYSGKAGLEKTAWRWLSMGILRVVVGRLFCFEVFLELLNHLLQLHQLSFDLLPFFFPELCLW